MRKGRASRGAALVVAGAIGALGLMGPAQAWPGCEQWMSQEDCDKYYYGTSEKLGEIVNPVWWKLYETEKEAWATVLWAVDTYNGIYRCTVPWGYCPD